MSSSTFGKRNETPERRNGDRRRGRVERRKNGRRSTDAADSQAVIYREWSDMLRDMAEADRHAERRRTLLKLAAEYARIATVLNAGDAT
jgi:hypothetical protein